MPRMRRRAEAGADWQPPPEWFAPSAAGQNAITGNGEIGQSGFAADVVRQPNWRRIVGLLMALIMLLPIVGGTVLLIIRLR